jgi:hypothetical protein
MSHIGVLCIFAYAFLRRIEKFIDHVSLTPQTPFPASTGDFSQLPPLLADLYGQERLERRKMAACNDSGTYVVRR